MSHFKQDSSNQCSKKDHLTDQDLAKLLNGKSWLVWLLISIFAMVLLGICRSAGISIGDFLWPNPSTFLAMESLGALRPILVERGETWRLLTSIFLHHGIFHFLCNSMALLTLGTFVQNLYGKRNFLLLFLFSGIIASIVSFKFQPSNMLGCGASGAIFGLIGVGLAFRLQYGKLLPPFFAKAILSNFLFWGGVGLAIGFFIPQIDNFAHLGGLVGGFVLAFFFSPRNFVTKEKFYYKIFAYQSIFGLLFFTLSWIPSENFSLNKSNWSPKKKSFSSFTFQKYDNSWIHFEYPSNWTPTVKIEEKEKSFSLLLKDIVTMEVFIFPRGSRDDLTSFIDIYFESLGNNSSKKSYKIPRSDRKFPCSASEKELMGKTFGYVSQDFKGNSVLREVEVVFTDTLMFMFRYSRLEEDSLAKKIFQKIQKTVLIKKTDGSPWLRKKNSSK